jgi:putative inorganic carbon (hco3(-)) transporter
VNERLAFSFGGGGGTSGQVPSSARRFDDLMTAPRSVEPVAHAEVADETQEKRDWGFLGLLLFTAVLYFRPQDQIPGLSILPLAEIAALFGLGAMVYNRMSRGQTFSRITPELLAVAGLALVMLLTAPFSVWKGGAIHTFTDRFAKVLLIYVLMTNTLTSLLRVQRFMMIVIAATGYLAARAVFDYLRGFNLIENGRVQGAVGGMFQNPNDLALNMVSVLPMAVLWAVAARRPMHRLFAASLALMMLFTIVMSYSRGGFVGLAVMVLILGYHLARQRPAAVAAAALGLVLVLPLAPSSYWNRIASITDESKDDTGSRKARRIAMREAWQTFLTFPFYGVGAGMFEAYNPPGREEIWRETHNVVLQVAAELGILGLALFFFMMWRALTARSVTRRLLRRASGAAPPSRWQPSQPSGPALVTKEEAIYIDAHTGTMTASVIGWFVCALFASVAYTWTFYYLLALTVAPRDILKARLAGAAKGSRPAPAGARL